MGDNVIAKFAFENPDAVKNMCKDLRRWIKKAATDAVYETAKQAKENLIESYPRNFILRGNNFLKQKNVLFVSKPPFGHVDSLRDIRASVGFTEKADFMRRQDEGGFHNVKPPAAKLRIYTDAAREGGVKEGAVQRGYGYKTNAKKMIIPYIKKSTYRSARSLYVRRAFVAFKSGKLRYAGPSSSLFRVTKFVSIYDRVTKTKHIEFKQEMIINRKFTQTYTPAKNFFMPECEKAMAGLQKRFNEFMDKSAQNH